MSARLAGLGPFIKSAAGAGSYGIGVLALDLVVAAQLGTQTESGIFYAAWLLITIVLAIFSSGAIQGAFLPLYAQVDTPGPRAERTASALTVVSGTLLLTSGILVMAADELIALVASGFSAAQREAAARVLRMLVPLLLAHALASLLTSLLLQAGRQFRSAVLPVLIPLGGVLALLAGGATAAWLACGSVLGAVAYLLLTWLACRDDLAPGALWPGHASRDGMRRFAGQYWMAGVAHAALSMLLLLSQSLAGHVSSHALAIFVFGTRLVLLAQAFMATIVINVSLPVFARLMAAREYLVAWRMVRSLLLRSLLLLVPMTLVWMLASTWLVELLFRRGQFTLADVEPVAEIQRIFVLQLPLYVTGVIAWRMCNALQKSPILIGASCLALAINVILGIWLVPIAGASGVAVAYVAGILGWMLCLYVLLRRALLSAADAQLRR